MVNRKGNDLRDGQPEVDDLSNLGKVDNLSNPSKSKLSSVSNSDIDSVLEPECRDEGGAPASGLPAQSNFYNGDILPFNL